MKRAANEIVYLEKKVLNIILLNRKLSIEEIYKFRLYIEFIVFSNINYNRINKKSTTVSLDLMLSEMFSLKLVPSNIHIFYKNHQYIIDREYCRYDWSSLSTNDIGQLRETLLDFEITYKDQNINFVSGKESKDAIGAYYTPTNMSKAVIKESVKQLKLEDDLDKKVKIIDLSCGCGEFFNNIQELLLDKYNINFDDSSTFLWGVDVDPISLQIAVCNILMNASTEKWTKIISHFILGNPLLYIAQEKEMDKKVDCFALKRIYAKEMGLNITEYLNGFDMVIGNPPWEKVRFEERKFFKSIKPEISLLSKKDQRRKLIIKLEKLEPDLYDWYKLVSKDYEEAKQLIKNNPLLKHSLHGELNTYILFTELAYGILSVRGIATLIVKTALITSPGNRKLFNYFLDNNNIYSIFLFENKNKIFNIDSREKFCVVTIGSACKKEFELIAGIYNPEEMFSLTKRLVDKQTISIINPLTNMLPNIASFHELNILEKAHKKNALFTSVYPECHFGRIVHLTTHSNFITTREDKSVLPIYEGKFIEQYDGRFATFDGVLEDKKYSNKAFAIKIPEGPNKPLPQSRFFIKRDFWKELSKNYNEEYTLYWRSLTSNTNARTTIAMVLPTIPACQSLQMLQTHNIKDLIVLLGLFNSMPFDYLVRMKMPGIDLTQTVIKQIPVPPKEAYSRKLVINGIKLTVEQYIIDLVGTLLSKEDRVNKLIEPMMQSKLPKSINREGVRFKLDQVFVELYGFTENEYDIMVKTFKK
jgi:hypothetical protein